MYYLLLICTKQYMTQQGVEQFSQNFNMPSRVMPGRRSRRSYARPRYSTRSRIPKATNVRRTWPNKSMGTSQRWDPFPAKAKAILRYSEVVYLVPTSGAATSYLFRASSIFDPNLTSTGHQPMGHDTYATIYNHYLVTKSTISMTPTANANGMFGILLADDNIVTIDYDGVRENKTGKTAMCTTNGSVPTVVQTYNHNQTFNSVTDGTSAEFGSNPTDTTIFQCFWEPNSSSGAGFANYFLINIEYEVDMWELKDLERS